MTDAELTIRPVLLVKRGRHLAFDQAQAEGRQNVIMQPCQQGHPDIAGYGIFPLADGKVGQFQSVFAQFKDAAADIEARQS